MRSVVLAVGFTLAAASVAQSQQAQSLQQAQSPASTRNFVPQQAVVAASAQAPDLRPVDAPIGMTRSQAGVDAVNPNQMAEPGAAAVDPSTRNTLAIIGAIVVVIALVALVM